MKNQCAAILNYLQQGNTLTPLEGLRHFNTLRLGARIWDLRHAGHQIESRTVRQNGKAFAEYRLIKPKGQMSLLEAK